MDWNESLDCWNGLLEHWNGLLEHACHKFEVSIPTVHMHACMHAYTERLLTRAFAAGLSNSFCPASSVQQKIEISFQHAI